MTTLLAAIFPLNLHGAEGVIVPAITFVFVGAIVITAMYFKHQRRQMWHETARLALEKGQPLPPMGNFDGRGGRKCNDIRTGLILIAVGAGLFLMFGASNDRHGPAFVGAIPGLIGVALLLHGILTGQLSKDKGDAKGSPPTT